MQEKNPTKLLENLKDFILRLEPATLTEEKGAKLADFNKSKQQHYLSGIERSIADLRTTNFELIFEIRTIAEKEKLRKIKSLIETIEKNIHNRTDSLKNIDEAINEIRLLKEKDSLKITLPVLPAEISPDVLLDLQEIERCFNANCFRSVTILCGRILEIALHRKYYEITKTDILETQPGIGLGKLIAKLREKNFEFGQGITEQIHLINQVRISSVHKKGNSFYPSRHQANAMILYTLDVLRKLFPNQKS
jgi:hypothetical protein